MALTQVTTEMLENNAITTVKITDVNVTTAKIADNAITLAKLASGTDGEIITYDASGNPTTLAVGTVQGNNTATLFHSGEFLQTGGAGAEPTWKVPLLSKYYVSAETSIAADTLHTFGHGLGAYPIMTHVILKCSDSGGDAAWADNDEVDISSLTDTGADTGMSVVRDATNVYVNVAATIAIINKTSFNGSTLTLSKWKLVVRAWT
tara:strand:- start:107 stop:724 length:618 start_codon:yes stop_codon:yes gene_type:complete